MPTETVNICDDTGAVVDTVVIEVPDEPAPDDPPAPVTVPADAVTDLVAALDEHPLTLDGMHTALSDFAARLIPT